MRNARGVFMRMLIFVALVTFLPTAAFAENPEWAYPGPPPANLPMPDPSKVVKVPGSDKEYRQTDIGNPFAPADWFPTEHALMPAVVANGVRPDVPACSLCHLPTGDGHPESASIAGLSANYIVRQLKEFKDGNRTGSRAAVMVTIAKALSDADAHAAADYFAARKQAPAFFRVVEGAAAPKSYVGAGSMRFAVKDGGTEPIGDRIIELPQNEREARLRDPHFGFVAHVPPGILMKGKALAETGGGGKTLACVTCHGPGLKGLGEVPGIANRSAIYLYRQLNDMKTGAHKGSSVALMKQVVAKLDPDDMLSLAAYAVSLEP